LGTLTAVRGDDVCTLTGNDDAKSELLVR
jgi:hypothetical protein